MEPVSASKLALLGLLVSLWGCGTGGGTATAAGQAAGGTATLAGNGGSEVGGAAGSAGGPKSWNSGMWAMKVQK